MASRLKVSDMLNLGPAVEKDLNASGIYYASEVRELGSNETFIKMLEGRKKTGRSAKCCNALYLYSIYGAIHDINAGDIPESKKIEFREFAQKLRESGKY